MISIQNLQVGDVIVSHKAVKPWQLVNRYFDWRVKEYSLEVFGPECSFPEANHVRIVVGRDMDDILWGFHWTAPFSTFCKIEPWMVDPSYAQVFHYPFGEATMGDFMNECLKREGDAYNLGSLLDMEFGFRRFFDFGRNHYVCSSGVLMLQQKLLGVDVGIKPSKAPPCLWANFPDLFMHTNGKANAAPLLCEPT